MFDQSEVGAFQRISTTLPKPIYNKLVKALRPSFSRSSEGKLDRGIMSDWLLEQTLDFLNKSGKYSVMERFLISKGLVQEFEEYFKQQTETEVKELTIINEAV